MAWFSDLMGSFAFGNRRNWSASVLPPRKQLKRKKNFQKNNSQNFSLDNLLTGGQKAFTSTDCGRKLMLAVRSNETFSTVACVLWGKQKFNLLVRKIYLRESASRFRDEIAYHRHFALCFYSEFEDSRQTRKDHLVQARLAKARLASARAKMATTQVFTPEETAIIQNFAIMIVLGALLTLIPVIFYYLHTDIEIMPDL
jgi:hypothetical protein